MKKLLIILFSIILFSTLLVGCGLDEAITNEANTNNVEAEDKRDEMLKSGILAYMELNDWPIFNDRYS